MLVDHPIVPGGDLAASFGMQLSRPFHDQRVVELALAIPPDLLVRNGRNRYLACRALADVYPAAFQTRSRQNDSHIPGHVSKVRAAAPSLAREIDRLASTEAADGLDLASARRTLTTIGPVPGTRYAAFVQEQAIERAMNTVLVARYRSWITPLNIAPCDIVPCNTTLSSMD